MFENLIENIEDIQREIIKINSSFDDLIKYIDENSHINESGLISLIISNLNKKITNLLKLRNNLFYFLDKNSKILNKLTFEEKKVIEEINLFLFNENQKNLKVLEYLEENHNFLLKKIDSDISYFENLKNIRFNGNNLDILLVINREIMSLIQDKEIELDKFLLIKSKYKIILNLLKNKLNNKNITIKKGILAGIGISIATALTLGLYNPKTEETHNQELNQISQIKEETINRDINKPKRILDNNKTIILNNNSFKSNKLEFEKDINSKLKEESSDDFNSKFNDEQKTYLLEFEKKFEKDKNKYINKLQTENILDKNNNLKLSYINSRLIPIFTNLAKKEDINLNLVLFMSLIESTFGKQNKSDIGAIGPLQVMPFVMKANCYKSYIYKINKFGKKTGEKNFYSDLFLQIIAGMREIKNIAKQYNIDISYNSKYINKYNLIMISSSYNSGRTNMRNKPYKLIENKETYGHSLKMLALNEVVKKIQ